MTIVYNCNGTSDNSASAHDETDWKVFWEHKTGKKFMFCSNEFCFNFAEVGAHVRIKNNGNKQYIVPFCKECNGLSSDKEIMVSDNDLVPVND